MATAKEIRNAINILKKSEKVTSHWFYAYCDKCRDVSSFRPNGRCTECKTIWYVLNNLKNK